MFKYKYNIFFIFLIVVRSFFIIMEFVIIKIWVIVDNRDCVVWIILFLLVEFGMLLLKGFLVKFVRLKIVWFDFFVFLYVLCILFVMFLFFSVICLLIFIKCLIVNVIIFLIFWIVFRVFLEWCFCFLWLISVVICKCKR